jgi:hypothetical protein
MSGLQGSGLPPPTFSHHDFLKCADLSVSYSPQFGPTTSPASAPGGITPTPDEHSGPSSVSDRTAVLQPYDVWSSDDRELLRWRRSFRLSRSKPCSQCFPVHPAAGRGGRCFTLSECRDAQSRSFCLRQIRTPAGQRSRVALPVLVRVCRRKRADLAGVLSREFHQSIEHFRHPDSVRRA